MTSIKYLKLAKTVAPATALFVWNLDCNGGLQNSDTSQTIGINRMNTLYCEGVDALKSSNVLSGAGISPGSCKDNFNDSSQHKVPVAEVYQEECKTKVEKLPENNGAVDSKDNSELFHGLFPIRQLWKQKLPYPLWDKNWDERKEEITGNYDSDSSREKFVRKHGVTRHIILVRHGQYNMTYKEDEKRILTPLGREQAELTGVRLAEMIRGIDPHFEPCNVKVVRTSGMARAKETLDIILTKLPQDCSIEIAEPDTLLNEGRPSHHIPGGRVSSSIVERTDEDHPRIEAAFRKYFYRADPPKQDLEKGSNTIGDDKEKKNNGKENDAKDVGDSINKEEKVELKHNSKHEFEIIVCHANVIRYFLCRALQLPPEAWLRFCVFNGSLTYLTIRPTGSVSCRMLGDIGHMGVDHSTFSSHHGFNW